MDNILGMASKKLEALCADIRTLINERDNKPLTEEEYTNQLASFIVGNGFDIFEDAETINHGSVKTALMSRLSFGTTKIGNHR